MYAYIYNENIWNFFHFIPCFARSSVIDFFLCDQRHGYPEGRPADDRLYILKTGRVRINLQNL